MLLLATLLAAVPALGLSALLRLAVERILQFLLIVCIAWLCVRIVDVFIFGLNTFLTARKRSIPFATLSLSSRILKLAIMVFAFTALLGDWGYNTSTILAGLGVGGIAIALAAQKTIENLCGGVAVIGDRPVKVGYYCRFGSNSGTVEDIGLRSTCIRTDGRTLVTAPNGAFSAMTLENFSHMDKMLFHITLNLRRDTTPDQVRTVLETVGRTLREHPKIEAGAIPVRFVGIGSYSLDIEIYIYILTTDGSGDGSGVADTGERGLFGGSTSPAKRPTGAERAAMKNCRVRGFYRSVRRRGSAKCGMLLNETTRVSPGRGSTSPNAVLH